MTAFRAFWKALKDPKKAEEFLVDKPQITVKENEKSDLSHLRLLSLMQQSSRLIDFLKEDLSSFSDAQVGAAVRKIHTDSAKSLEELVTIRPVFDEEEGTKITIPQGYDPSEIKIIGNVKGEPPFVGTLVHKGWKAVKRSLPKKMGEQATDVIYQAEIEVK